jgi:hypothetical protein
MYMCHRKGVGVVSGGRGSRETEGHCDREQHLEFIPELDDAISYRLNDQSAIPGRGGAAAATTTTNPRCGAPRNDFYKRVIMLELT